MNFRTLENTMKLSFLAGVTLALGIGCSRYHVAPPMDIAQVPTEINKAFDGSAGDAHQAATDYVSALKGKDAASAFVKLQGLSARTDLTPAQRATAARALAATFQQLRAAAQSGNAQAAEVMHQYISTR
jgi:hypothetical protein